MSPARFLVSLIIFISFFILTVSAKGHHRHAPSSTTGQPPNRGTNVGGSTAAAPRATHTPPTTTLPPPSPQTVNAPPTPASPTPPRRGAVAREFLKAHNLVRMKHNQTLYKWDKTVARFARRWALTRAVDCRMIHSMGPYGENMFWGKYDHWTATDAVQSWAMEDKNYNADTNQCTPNKMCGHYTQIVWHESLLLGCSRMRCYNGSVVVICEYDPPGNYLGESPFGKIFDNQPIPRSEGPQTLPPPTATPTSMTSSPSNSSPSTLPPSTPSNSSPSTLPPPPPSPQTAA
ncbi:hypothetical protein FEM48_Zijuj12G0150000 [Ziziphus jujuba var. spinosa]|uniref:SCP domain-containing protein n=1 Tax=Ziziphus jujuba var. spinosa TaxID=714518 RepID=A0A978UE07_ZIZJJ|nr:hypothetical protein FEM48_Zijuj12G0150000 [Ziziphus jujuba var. spinosa]